MNFDNFFDHLKNKSTSEEERLELVFDTIDLLICNNELYVVNDLFLIIPTKELSMSILYAFLRATLGMTTMMPNRKLFFDAVFAKQLETRSKHYAEEILNKWKD